MVTSRLMGAERPWPGAGVQSTGGGLGTGCEAPLSPESSRKQVSNMVFTYYILWLHVFRKCCTEQRTKRKTRSGHCLKMSELLNISFFLGGKALPIRRANSAPNGLGCLTRRWCLNILSSSEPSWQKSSTKKIMNLWRYHRYHKESLYLIVSLNHIIDFYLDFQSLDMIWDGSLRISPLTQLQVEIPQAAFRVP